MLTKFQSGNLKRKKFVRKSRIIREDNIKIDLKGMRCHTRDWIYLTQDMVQRPALVSMLMNRPCKAESLLTIWMTTEISRWTLLLGVTQAKRSELCALYGTERMFLFNVIFGTVRSWLVWLGFSQCQGSGIIRPANQTGCIMLRVGNLAD
jgi:hypothetical protein